MVRWSIRLRCVGHLWLGLAAVGSGLLGLVHPLLAQSANQAGLVVVHGDGQIVSRCVAFTEPQISGYDLLQRSGLDLNIEVNGIGAAICRIDGEGCTYPQQSCFCGTEGDSYIYWSYWQWLNDSWQYANQGASNHLVQPGAVQGWVWGAGTNNSANPPPAIAFTEVCVAPTATPSVTPTASPTVTPTVMPTAIATPLPTASPTNPPTLAPTATPSPSLTWTAVPLPTPTGTATWTATPPPPQIALFAVNPLTVTLGQAATLLWQVQNASQVLLRSAEGETLIGSVGNLVVQPQQSSTYTLIARNAGGEVMDAVSLGVAPPPALSAAPAALPPATLAPTTAVPTTPPVPTVAPTATAPLPLPTAQVTPTATLALLPTATMTTPLPLSMAQPVQSTISTTGAFSPVIDAAAVTPIVLAVAPRTPSSSFPDPATTRLQVVTVLGGVVLVLIVPLSILGLVALLWLVRNNR